jgi:hypothetical protein
MLKNWELHISSNHGFIKLKDGKLFSSKNNSSNQGFIMLKNMELHLSSNHGFIKLKDSKLFNSKNNSSKHGFIKLKKWEPTSAPTMASSSSRIVSYSIQRTIVPTRVLLSSKLEAPHQFQPLLHLAQGW